VTTGDRSRAKGPGVDPSHSLGQLLLGRAAFTPELLESDTEYTVTVIVYDEEGRASLPETISFRTDPAYSEDRAVQISAFGISEVEAMTAQISFTTDMCAGSAFYLDGELLHEDGYPDNAACWNQHGFPLGDRSELLEPNTSYVVRVEARSRFGVVTVDERAFTTAAE